MRLISSQHLKPTYASIYQNGPAFVLSVGSDEPGTHNAGSVQLSREELKELIEDATTQLNNAAPQVAQGEVLGAVKAYAEQNHRLKALEMARSTPGISGHEQVLKAATVYYGYILKGDDPGLSKGVDYD